jgi:hypothetical protein
MVEEEMSRVFRSVRLARLGFLKQDERPSLGIRGDGRDIHFSSENGYYD